MSESGEASGGSQNSLQMTLSPSQEQKSETGKSKKHARFSVANVTSDENSRKNSDVDIVPELPSENHENHEHQKSHQKSHHSHHSGSGGTYNTWYFKSLRHYLTRDVLPAEHNYRNLLSLDRQNPDTAWKYSRPTLDELHYKSEELNQKLLPHFSQFHMFNSKHFRDFSIIFRLLKKLEKVTEKN